MQQNRTRNVEVVAEIGTGHDGDLVRARELIQAAREAGADCAKFQMVIADEILHPKTGTVPLPTGEIRLYDRFRALERTIEFYAQLNEECRRAGLAFLCTPFGIGSARALRSIGVDRLKIASPELNHLPLIAEVAGYGIPLILSSGVSRLADIEEALETAESSATSGESEERDRLRRRVMLLHCVTAYPAPPADYNLRLLPTLERLFGTQVGVSDHSLDPILVPLLSVAMGARMVEKHITLRRSDRGLDDPVALEPADFRRMTDSVHRASGEKPEEIVNALSLERGRETVESVLGSGIKRVSPAEQANYGRTNRSIHACNQIDAGRVIGERDVALLRTEKVLRPGLHPRHMPTVVGARARRTILAGDGVVWEDLVDRGAPNRETEEANRP